MADLLWSVRGYNVDTRRKADNEAEVMKLMFRYTILSVFVLFGLTETQAAWKATGFNSWRDSVDANRGQIQLGQGIENYRRPDGVWDSIQNRWVVSAGMLYDTLGLLQLSVNDSAVSTLRIVHDSINITITQEPIRLVWFDTTDNTYANMVTARTYNTPTVNGNVVRWNNFWPGVDWAIRSGKSQTEHAVIFKPVFLDTVVARYNRRADSAQMAIGNVVRYVLAGVNSADTVNRTMTRRELKRIGQFAFGLDEQRLQWVGSDTSQVPLPIIRQRWVKVLNVLYCIEYVMASDLKRFHVALPTQPLYHNATFTIGAGTGSEADGTYINEAGASSNYGAGTRYWLGGSASGTDTYVLLNWPALKDSLFGRTVDSCFLSVKPQAVVLNTDGLFACFQIRTGRPWIETQSTWNNYITGVGWSTAGAKNTASDIFSTPVDAKTESEFSELVYTVFNITSIAQQWDGLDTANCRGVVLKQYSGSDATAIDLASDDATTAGNRPKIRVVYHTAAITYVQGTTVYAGTPLTLNSVGAGNLLIAAVSGGSSCASVTLSDGVNTWTRLTASNAGATYSVILYAVNGGAANRTVTMSSAPSDPGWSLHEYSGLSATPFDVEAVDSITTTVYSSAMATTTQADELLFGFYANEAGASADSALLWTTRTTNTTHYDRVRDMFVSAAGAYRFNGTQNNNANGCATMATFKVAGAGGTPTPPRRRRSDLPVQIQQYGRIEREL